FDLGCGQPKDADVRQGCFDRIEFLRLNDRFDHFHHDESPRGLLDRSGAGDFARDFAEMWDAAASLRHHFVRDLFRGDRIDVLRIGRDAHFGDVQPGDFDLGRDAVSAYDLADDPENYSGDDQVPRDADADVEALNDELLRVAVE